MLADRAGPVVTVPVELAGERSEPVPAEVEGLDRRIEVDPAEALCPPGQLRVLVATRPLVVAAHLRDRLRAERAQIDGVDKALAVLPRAGTPPDPPQGVRSWPPTMPRWRAS